MNAADTNVYVYALDADEPVKQAKALSLTWNCTHIANATLRDPNRVCLQR